MKIIDLTHVVAEDTPVYPGSKTPKLVAVCSCESDGFKETSISMYSHTGTHMDAPAHVFPGGRTLDSMSADSFSGSAVALDCRGLKHGELISMKLIDQARELCDDADFILFHTGWSKRWGSAKYFSGYPCISREVARYVSDSRKKGVGVDAISVDPVGDAGLTIHKLLLSREDMVIVENLTNLEQIGAGLFTFCSLPLKFKNSDGAPARAIALME